MREKNAITSLVHRNILIALRLLNGDDSIRYSQKVPTTRWGDAITRLLAERGWTKRHLADAASVRPNTLTNLIKHGRDSDTATLARVAAALKVDIAELFLTREQSVILRSHDESRIERLRDLVVKELSDTVTRLVTEELKGTGQFSENDFRQAAGAEPSRTARPRRKKKPKKS